MDNCIRYINPSDPDQLLVDIPCEQIKFPNFNNSNFDSDEFDKYINKLYSIKDKTGFYPYKFTENYLSQPFPDIFHLHTSQRFLAKYINYHNNFADGCLVFHKMGSGKTISSIIVAEAYKYYYNNINRNKRVIIVVPASLKEQYINEIFSEGTNDIRITVDGKITKLPIDKYKKQIEKFDSMKLHHYDSEDIGEQSKIYKNLKKIEQLKKNKEQKIYEYLYNLNYEIYTHEYFINRLKDILGITNSSKINQSKLLWKKLNEGNQLLVFDEIQNLISEVTPESGKRYDILKNTLNLVTDKNNRYVFLTGTPIKDKPDEIGKLINLLNPRVYFPSSRNDFNKLFITKDKNKNNIMINKDLFRWMTKGYVSYFKGGNPRFFPIKEIKYVYHVMCKNQLDAYIDILKKEQEKIKRSLERIRNDPNITDDDMPKTFLTIPREYCVSYLTPHTNDKNKINNFKRSIENYESFEQIYNIVESDYSPKIAKITKMSIQCEGKSFIYCDYKVFGTFIFKVIFNILGYEVIPYDKNINFKIPKPRIIIWSGGLSEQEKKIIHRAINVFNSPKNKDGSFIKTVIGTSTIKEGISFKGVKDVHIVSPWWNNSRIDQIIARAIRFKSHEEGEIVNVYKHISIMNNELKHVSDISGILNTVSVDQYMDILSFKKQTITSQFENCLKETSIDCVLNKYGNLVRLTKITENNWRTGKPVSFSYYLNESTNQCYNITKNKLPGKEIRLNRDNYNSFTIDELNKSFNYILDDYPLITYENIKCSSGININTWYEKLDNKKKYKSLYNMLINFTYASKINLNNYTKKQLEKLSKCLIQKNKNKLSAITKSINNTKFKEKNNIINNILSKTFPKKYNIYNNKDINKNDPEFDDINEYKKFLWEQDLVTLRVL